MKDIELPKFVLSCISSGTDVGGPLFLSMLTAVFTLLIAVWIKNAIAHKFEKKRIHEKLIREKLEEYMLHIHHAKKHALEVNRIDLSAEEKEVARDDSDFIFASVIMEINFPSLAKAHKAFQLSYYDIIEFALTGKQPEGFYHDDRENIESSSLEGEHAISTRLIASLMKSLQALHNEAQLLIASL